MSLCTQVRGFSSVFVVTLIKVTQIKCVIQLNYYISLHLQNQSKCSIILSWELTFIEICLCTGDRSMRINYQSNMILLCLCLSVSVWKSLINIHKYLHKQTHLYIVPPCQLTTNSYAFSVTVQKGDGSH